MEAALSQRSTCTKTVFISLREPCPRVHHNLRCSNNLWDSSTRKEKEFATLRLTLTHTRLRHVCRDDCWVDRSLISLLGRGSMRFKLSLAFGRSEEHASELQSLRH